MVDITSAFHAL